MVWGKRACLLACLRAWVNWMSYSSKRLKARCFTVGCWVRDPPIDRACGATCVYQALCPLLIGSLIPSSLLFRFSCSLALCCSHSISLIPCLSVSSTSSLAVCDMVYLQGEWEDDCTVPDQGVWIDHAGVEILCYDDADADVE